MLLLSTEQSTQVTANLRTNQMMFRPKNRFSLKGKEDQFGNIKLSFSILKRKSENNIDTYSSLHPKGIARADYHCRRLYNLIQTGLFWPSLALRNSRTIRATDHKSQVLCLVKGPFRQIFLGGGGEVIFAGLIHGRIFAF